MGAVRKEKTVEDTVCEIHKFGGYAVLSKCFVRSTELDCGAIGLLARIMDFPSTWVFTKAGLKELSPDGETSIDTSLNHLQDCGYVVKKTVIPNESDDGRMHTYYSIYEYSAKDTSIPQYDCELEAFTLDNATLYRTDHNNNFTMVSRKLLRNKNIPNKLLGFLLKVLSLPNYWQFSMLGLAAICKEGKTAVHNAVNKLIDMGHLVRTKLLSNESKYNNFEYIYRFSDVAVSKDEADEIEAETRRSAIEIRKGGLTKRVENVEKSAASSSFTPEKQGVENPYLDNPPAENPPSENQGQYNKKQNNKKNQLLCDKSSIIPSAQKAETFNNPNVEKSNDRMNETYTQEEKEAYADLVRHNISYYDLGEWLTTDTHDGFKEADNIVNYIVDEICSSAPYLVVRKTPVYRSTVQSMLLKADINMVENTLIKLADVDEEIRNYQRYFVVALYNEIYDYYFKEGCEERWANRAVAKTFGYPA